MTFDEKMKSYQGTRKEYKQEWVRNQEYVRLP